MCCACNRQELPTAAAKCKIASVLQLMVVSKIVGRHPQRCVQPNYSIFSSTDGETELCRSRGCGVFHRSHYFLRIVILVSCHLIQNDFFLFPFISLVKYQEQTFMLVILYGNWQRTSICKIKFNFY